MTNLPVPDDEPDAPSTPALQDSVAALAEALRTAHCRADHDEIARLMRRLEVRLDQALVNGLAPRARPDRDDPLRWPST
jgi:hypothetical protein